MSAATAEPADVEQPSFAVDPMMAEPGQGASKPVSFSDLEELPPLKEIDIAPPPPPIPQVTVEAPVIPPPTLSMRLRTAKEEKPKFVTRQNAQKAVREIKKVPPKLMVYAVSAAVAIVLLVVVGIAIHIHNENADDDASAAPASAAPAPAAAETPAQPQAQAAPVETQSAPEPEVVVKPHYAPKPRKIVPIKPVMVPGQLAINSTPEGAQVQIDGRTDPTWLTPYTMTGVNPGQHSISVSKAGYTPEARSVSVNSGSKSFLTIHLAQLGATVTVASEPAGASIFVDGKDTGHVTPAQIVTPQGTHTFLVRKQGYLDETTTANLAAGQIARFAPTLRVMGITDDIRAGGGGKLKHLFGGGESAAGMSKVSIKTQPKGAQITVNRRMIDKPTPVDFMLNPGNYVIEITMSGYRPIERVVSVQQGSKLELNESMEPQ